MNVGFLQNRLMDDKALAWYLILLSNCKRRIYTVQIDNVRLYA
jgi:hypothetical protein